MADAAPGSVETPPAIAPAADPTPAGKPPRITERPPRDRPRDRDPGPSPRRDPPKPTTPKPDEPKPIDPFAASVPPAKGASDEDKQKADFYVKLGKSALSSGNYVAAATNFNKAKGLNPKNAEAVAGLGEVALSQNSYSAAIRHLKSATRMRRSTRFFTLLGEAYLGAGNNGQAAEAFKRALQLDAANGRARRGYNEATGG